jgi:A/G-specific adenine glycosylase
MPLNTPIFVSSILHWYAKNKRDLPWRNTKDPYLIWLSEVILQQTRIEQGTPYYHAFADRYPNLRDLAQASEQEVLNLWQGLGYYSRGRNLHAAAKRIVEQHNGVFPKTYDEIRALPGIGDYTAAAISSFAYNGPYAVLDGNVFRLLSRYFNISDEIDSPEGKKQFKELADSLLFEQDPGTYNHAIMDFGSVVCRPKKPNCEICPLSDTCLGLKEQTHLDLPMKRPKRKKKERHFYFFLIEDDQGNVLVQKRSSKDIWQGLTHPPLLEYNHNVHVEGMTTCLIRSKN